MACGCACPTCRQKRDMEFRVPPEDVRGTPPPLADWYASPRMTLPREPEREDHATSQKLAAYEANIPHADWIGPKDTMEPVLSINDAYAHRLLRVRATVPRPEWRHATGFSTIASRQIEALEAPRYSFAALDTQGLVDEVYGSR